MMKMTRLMIVLALLGAVTCAFAQLPGDPPWRQGAESFTYRDGVIYADDNPFLLIYDFTWSADKDARFYEFSEDWGGTASHEQVPAYDAAAAHHVYLGWAGSVAHDGVYLREHPEAAMLLADGSRARNAQVCFLNPDYRAYLAANLTELATGMRDKPFNMGYYPQDEFAYRENGCYCEVCRQRFRERLQESYGTIAALNEAWGTNHADFAAIQPPEAFEKSRAFCDWQEFRRWSQLDFAKFVYDTLKANDPEHVVIWSLPFWGSWIGGAAWWDFPEVSDVLMRHGIGYHTGIYRFTLMRDVAEWSGVPGNSLGMPPDFNPGYAQMSYIMDGPRTGLSHVCFAGAPDPTYQGVADSNDNYRRREPMYTVSRAINDQMYQLGDIYLLSKQRDPQVGVYASDRTLLVNGIGTRELNGLLLMLHDLNVDFRIFSEHNLGDLSRFPAIIVADCSRVVSDEIAQQFREYVAGGGNLIFQDGAFAADWYNQDVGNPGHGFDEVIGSTEGESTIATAAVSFDAAETGLQDLPPQAPVTRDRATAVRQPTTATVIGTLPEGQAVVTLGDYGEGSVLYIGADLGSIYYSSWTEGYRDVMETDDRAQALDDNAYGYDFRPQTSASVEPMRGTKAWAQLIRSYLRSCGVGDNVVIDGYTEGVGVLKTKSFRTGDSYWVGFANRLVNPGLKHIETPPEELHQRLSDLQVRVRLDDGTAPAMAWVLPNQRRTDEGRTATTQVLPVSITEADGARWATFTLPELLDFATVAL
ncbi:MAG: family 14 glycosylhydrolase, partial [candidate division WS1 bacterium]|nr:family 14 glycosylhydrolase [candidate division WS1 bacterium]